MVLTSNDKLKEFLKDVLFEIEDLNKTDNDRSVIVANFPFWVYVLYNQNTNKLELFNPAEIEITCNSTYQGGIKQTSLFRESNIEDFKKRIQLFSINKKCIFINLSNDETYFFDIENNLSDEGEVCLWCGEKLPADLTARQKGKRMYCSDACKDSDRRFRKYLEKHLNEESLIEMYNLGVCGIQLLELTRKPCLNCGEMIPNDKPIGTKFCCDKCRKEYNYKKNK